MPADHRSMLNLEVPLIVLLASRDLAVEDVLALAPGSIIELPKKADDDLEILVNNRVIGTGTAVKVAQNFGVRITGVGAGRRELAAASAPPEDAAVAAAAPNDAGASDPD